MSGFHKPPMPRLQRGKLVTNGLVACWPLTDRWSSTARDGSGRQNHGTLTNITVNTDWKSARHGVALNYPSPTNNSVTVSDADLFDLSITSDFTWSMWGRSTSSALVQTLIEKRETTGVNKGYVLYIANSGMGFQLNDTSAHSYASYGSDYRNDGLWHHFAWVVRFTSDQAWLYVDGRLIATAVDISAVTASMVNAQPLKIGGHISTYGWGGLLSDVRLYARDLAHNEVQLLKAGLG